MTSLARLGRITRSSVAKGTLANLYGQAVQVVLQLAAVPVLANSWGLKTYGLWLMLSTIPSYLALGDLGFASAAANDMSMEVARTRLDLAAETFKSVRLGVWISVALLASVSAGVLASIPQGWMNHLGFEASVPIRIIAVLLLGYGLLSLQNSVSLAGFRAVGAYALGTALGTTVGFLETGCLLMAVWMGASMLRAAETLLIARCLGTLGLSLALHRRASWLVAGPERASSARLKRLLSPAIAVMALPASQALFLQGSTLAVGLGAGLAGVPAFNAVRTLSRVAVQITSTVNHAIMPAYSIAASQMDQTRRAQLSRLSFAVSVVVLAPTVVAMLLAGPWIVAFWTHSRVRPSYSLFVAMAGVMVVNGLWHPLSNLILAINRHASFSYAYLLASLGSAVLSYGLAHLFGSTGAAISLLVLDIFMATLVFRHAGALGILNSRMIAETMRALTSPRRLFLRARQA